MRTSFNRSLVASLQYLLDACVEVVPSKLFSNSTEKLSALALESKLSGLLSVVHRDLFNAIEQEDIEKIHRITERLAEDTFQVEEITYINLSEVNDYYNPLLREIFSQQLERKIEFFDFPSKEFEQKKDLLQYAVQVYKQSFPDFFKEFEELVAEILILKAEGMRNGSSSDAFGMIYKSSLFNCEKVTNVLDSIVHEQAHLYVHLLNKDDPLVLNPMEKYESPLRPEARPLIGIYHATFVIARIQYILNKALTYKVLPESERTHCKESITYYKKRFHVGYDILKKHAQMTPLAEGLIISASKLL